MDRPGSWPHPGSSRTVLDFLNSLNFKNDLPDFPGPSRTFQDHPEPSRQRYRRRVTDLATECRGSDPGQSVAVRELGVTVAYFRSNLIGWIPHTSVHPIDTSCSNCVLTCYHHTAQHPLQLPHPVGAPSYTCSMLACKLHG